MVGGRQSIWPTSWLQLDVSKQNALAGTFKRFVRTIEQNQACNTYETPGTGHLPVRLSADDKAEARRILSWPAAPNEAITPLFASYRRIRRDNMARITEAARHRDRRGCANLEKAIAARTDAESAQALVEGLQGDLGMALSGKRCARLAKLAGTDAGVEQLKKLRLTFAVRAAAIRAAPAAAEGGAGAVAAQDPNPVMIIAQVEPGAAAPTTTLKCQHPGCGKVYTSQRALHDHAQAPNAHTHNCQHPGCKKVFLSQEALSAHSRAHQPGKGHGQRKLATATGICRICNVQQCTVGSRLSTHMRTCKGITPHKCRLCELARKYPFFKSGRGLMIHKKKKHAGSL